MIWVFFILVALTALLIMVARARSPEAVKSISAVDHYKAQLKELETDLVKGMIDESGAEAAKLEIERRLLKAAKAGGDKPVQVSGGGTSAVMIIALAILGAGFALYTQMGRPDLPATSGERVQATEAQVNEGGPTFGEAIAQIQAHLADNPTDKQGYEVLAKTARGIGEYSIAANAFMRLAALDPSEPNWSVMAIESYLALMNGRFAPATRLLLQDFLRDNPEHPAGLYYLGQLHMQDGNEEQARAVWLALKDRSSPDAPWMQDLDAKLARLGVTPPKLDKEQADAVAAMSAEDQAAFIESMMDRLRARLAENPADGQGWMMLARSYASQGNVEAAIDALKQGLSHVPAGEKAQLQGYLDILLQN